jgi:hypothetical protein
MANDFIVREPGGMQYSSNSAFATFNGMRIVRRGDMALRPAR